MKIKELHHFSQLPFNVGTNTSLKNAGIPDHLPFTVGVDEETGRIVQMPAKKTGQSLRRAYRAGSLITGFMEGKGLGKYYAEDFLEFLFAAVGRASFSGFRVMEIGCGTGYLLHRMNDAGAVVLGIEPGPQGKVGSEKFGIEIVRDFFPPKEMPGSFDLIVQYGLLEHAEDPCSFLKKQKECLSDDGLIAISVPMCDSQIAAGDLSMLMHEHYSYFNKETLRNTLRMAGLSPRLIRKAGFGGAWYALVEKSGGSSIPGSRDINKGLLFVEGLNRTREIFTRMMKEAFLAGQTVGFYCPGRIINQLFLYEKNYRAFRPMVRFFDDSSRLHGRYYPCMNYPIEQRGELLSGPVDLLVVSSRTFGAKITAELRNEGYREEILPIENIFQNSTVSGGS